MTDWKPIESAPRDGSWVLVLDKGHPDDYAANVAVAFWGDKLAGFAPDNPENYAWLNWHEGIQYDDDSARWATLKPTHWMPLPPPPQEGEE